MNTKARIVATADNLFYQQGYEHTSFADIAKVVGISRGNFYHHFKTKDEILRAVIERRLSNMQQLIDNWQTSNSNPLDRIKSYFSCLTFNKDEIKMYGCPAASLSSEMTKLQHPLQGDSVRVFALFRNWLGQQFQLLNYPPEDADSLALRVISMGQGIAVLFTAFKDEHFLARELKLAFQWLDGLGFDPA